FLRSDVRPELPPTCELGSSSRSAARLVSGGGLQRGFQSNGRWDRHDPDLLTAFRGLPPISLPDCAADYAYFLGTCRRAEGISSHSLQSISSVKRYVELTCAL